MDLKTEKERERGRTCMYTHTHTDACVQKRDRRRKTGSDRIIQTTQETTLCYTVEGGEHKERVNLEGHSV